MKDYRQIIAQPEILATGKASTWLAAEPWFSFRPDLFHMARLSGQSTVAKE